MKSLLQTLRLVALASALLCAIAVQAQTPTEIQSSSGSNTKGAAPNGSITNGGTFNFTLPNVSLAGNMLVCGMNYDSTGPPTVAMQDDKGNTWALGATVTDVPNGAIASVWYALNVAAGTSVVQFKPTGNAVHDFAMACYEFNNIATSSATDGSSTHVATGSSVTAGSFTPTTSGDLIFNYVARNSSGTLVSYTQGSSPWVMNSADQFDGQAAQFQVQASAGAINPTMTASASHPYSSVAVAFKAASAGTALPAGERILRLHHINTKDETSATVTIQTPTKNGNLTVIAQSAGFNYRISSISDGGANTYTSVGCTSVSPDGACIFYAKNITTSAARSLTITMTGSDPGGHGSTFFIYEIAGADTTAPLDTGFGTSGFASASGNQDPTTGSGPITTFTATPSNANELAIVVGSVAADTATGWSSPTGAQQVPTTYSGELNPTNADENNPAGAFYNGGSTAAQTWIFTHDTINSAGAGTWVVVGAAFKPPIGASITVNVSETHSTTDSVTGARGQFRGIVQSAENRPSDAPLPSRGQMFCIFRSNRHSGPERLASITISYCLAPVIAVWRNANAERGPPA